MLSFSQIILSRGLYVNFEGNAGRLVNVSTFMHTCCSYQESLVYNTSEQVAISNCCKLHTIDVYLYVSLHWLLYRFGASIKIDVITPSTVYNQLAANPQCPFLYEDTSAIPENWTEVCYVTTGMVLCKSLSQN